MHCLSASSCFYERICRQFLSGNAVMSSVHGGVGGGGGGVGGGGRGGGHDGLCMVMFVVYCAGW